MWSLDSRYQPLFSTFMAQQAGSVFIYDIDALAAHARQLKAEMEAALPGRGRVWYACKANPLSHIIKALDQAGFSFDVASEGELTHVLAQGVAPEHILLTGPAKGEAFFRQALGAGVSTFVLESRVQRDLLLKLLPEYPEINPTVLLRVQLQWDGDQTSVLGGAQITPFGMDVQSAGELIRENTLQIQGVHVFQWGNILESAHLASIWGASLTQSLSLHPRATIVDVGGGLGVPYEPHEPVLSWSHALGALKKALAHAQAPDQFHVWMELGRYVTAPFGYFLTRVVDRKDVYGKAMLVLESGVNHLARPMLVGQPFPVSLLRTSTAQPISYALHGPLCTSLDFLGDHGLPADVQVGDILVFGQVGAYGFTESMPYFLCHDLPAEALLSQGVNEGQVTVVRPSLPASSWMR